MSNPTIQPTPTDAVLYLAGHVPMPANPIFFTTFGEAQELIGDLQAHGIVPAKVAIADVAYSYGPIMYGDDGRYCLGLRWTEPDDDGAGGTVQTLWEVNCGLLYWRWKELPAGQWRKTAGGSIGRW